MHSSRRRAGRLGFTLIELLVVIAIIAVLIGLLLPAVQKVREAANRLKCQSQLKQLALACHSYETANGAFPRGNAPGSAGTANCFSTGDCGASWLFLILPYIDQGALSDEVRAAGTLSAAGARGVLPRKLPFSRCPSDGFDPNNGLFCNYVGSSGPQCNNPPTGCPAAPFQVHCNGQSVPNQTVVPPALNPPTHPGYGPSMSWGNTSDAGLLRGMFARGPGSTGGPRVRMADVTDGGSATLFIGEMLPEFSEFQRYNNNTWGWAGFNSVAQGQTIQPINYRVDPMPVSAAYTSSCSQGGEQACPNGPARCLWNWHVTWGFKSRHPGGANFAFVDGSVRFVSETIDHQLYQYLGCRNDNQPVSYP